MAFKSYAFVAVLLFISYTLIMELVKIIKIIKRFFINIGTSGKFRGKRSFGTTDYLIRYVLMNFIAFSGSAILVVYTVYNIQRGMYLVAFVCAAMAATCIVVFSLARTKVKQIIPALIIMIFYGLFCVWIVWIRQSQGVNFLFIFVYPLLTIMMLGMRFGVILSSIMMAIVAAEMFVPGLSNYNYHINVSTRMLASYFLVFSTMIVIEWTRKTKDRLIETQHKKLEHQRLIMERQAAELKHYSDKLEIMVLEKTENIINLQDALLKTMAEMVECRDDITGGHIERTQRGVQILLNGIKEYSVYSEEIKKWNENLLLQSCQLHDVGKISISDQILKKRGKLDDEEYTEMKKHVVFGEEIIERIEAMTNESDFLNYAKIFACSHHEKWDGSGYPRGLKGSDIPLLGRIMAIADVYDALISVRPYKSAFAHEDAVRIIKDGSGKQFDPALVDVFINKADYFKKN